MDSSEEVEPLSSGHVDVSLETALEAASEVTPEPTEAESKPKRPKKPPIGTEERKQYQRDATAKTREKQNKIKAGKTASLKSSIEINDDRKREILTTERNLRHPHAIDVCTALGKVASQMLGIPDNEHLYRFGVQKTLEALETGKPATAVDAPDVWEPGQRIRVHEQYAVWDFSMSWRTQKDGHKIDFEEFKRLRRLCQETTYEAGRDVHGKDFAEQPHKRWADELFVRRNPDLLPEDYGHTELAEAMAAQSPIRRRCLLCARNSLKTTMGIFDIVGWVCCFHDCRFLICSSTTVLSKSLVKSFRQIFIVRDPLTPSLFQQLWPELTISDDTSVQNYTCPMRRLELVEPTLQASSAESSGQAGMRCSNLVFEDVVEQTNVTTPEQRLKVIETYSLLLELLDPSGFVDIRGTAWSAPTADGGCGDLYYEILKEEESAEEKQFAVLIDPCWRVKDGVGKEAYDPTLQESEVELMYPERLTFKWLKSKLGKTPQKIRTFRQQQLVQWVPDADEVLRIQFDPDVLTSACIPGSAVPEGLTVLSVDIATSLSSKADLSSIAAIRIFENAAGEKCICTLDIEAERLRGSELAYKLVEMTRKFKPSIVLIEKGPTSDGLRTQIEMTGAKYGITVPVHFVQPSNEKNSKFLRIHALELLLSQKRLKFKSGAYIDALFLELSRITGVRSGVRHDDRADAIAQAASVYKIYSSRPDKKTQLSAEEEGELERMQRQMRMRQQANRYFSGNMPTLPKPEPVPEPSEADKRRSMLSRILPPGMRA